MVYTYVLTRDRPERKEMQKYVFYLRNKEGNIVRMRNLIVAPPEGLMGAYTYEEALENFPEPTVFWESELGTSVGIALITNL